MVSVVIPLGNAERTIARTLRSAQHQTLRDIEIIVIDDGSSDRGVDIVRAMMRGDPRIVLRRQANAGVAAARNAGIAIARADFIATLDADDLWAPQKLAWQVRAFELGGTRVGVVYSYCDAIDARDRFLWAGPRHQIEGQALEPLLRDYFIGNGSNAMIRRSLLEAIGGFDTSLREAGAQGAEDWQVALKLAEICEFACVPDVQVGYRRTRGNMSGDAARMMRSARLVAAPFAEAYPQYAAAISAHIEDRHRWLLDRALGDGNLLGVISIMRDIGNPNRAAALTISVIVPVLRALVSRVGRGLGLRRRPLFLEERFLDTGGVNS